MRLDRFISHQTRSGKKRARALIESGKVMVDARHITDYRHPVDRFCSISCEGKILQNNTAHYVMLNKPAGILSATTDPKFQTAVDLILEPYSSDLHIAGRLDRASTGLLLLTNDGRWSKSLTEPDKKVPKVYHVTLRDPIEAHYHEVFGKGIYLAYEDLTTQPVAFTQVDECKVEITLREGRYHQIKRMFHAVGNQVISLHRSQIGNLTLGNLNPGCYKEIDPSII